MSRYRRWNDLLELLAAEGQLQVERAAELLGVSAATVRRDFDELAQQQMLRRIRGGAVAQGVTYDLPLRYKSERHPTEKQRIGATAAAMIRPGQVAGINGGTTCTEVARALAIRAIQPFRIEPNDGGKSHYIANNDNRDPEFSSKPTGVLSPQPQPPDQYRQERHCG